MREYKRIAIKRWFHRLLYSREKSPVESPLYERFCICKLLLLLCSLNWNPTCMVVTNFDSTWQLTTLTQSSKCILQVIHHIFFMEKVLNSSCVLYTLNLMLSFAVKKKFVDTVPSEVCSLSSLVHSIRMFEEVL